MKGNSFSYVIQLICLTVVSCEFYSSVHEVTKLVDYERFFLAKMERFVTLNENKLDYLKEKLSEFEREREDALETGKEYFENPINKYLLTKRLSLDWEKLENFLDHEVGSSVLKSIDKFKEDYKFPVEGDVNGAILGLLRLQQVYRLETKDIAKGILRGVKYSTELTAKDCYDIGKVAMKEENLLVAHAWMSEALDRSETYEPNAIEGKLEKPDILEPLSELKFKLGDFTGAAELSYALNLWRPNDKRLLDVYKDYSEHAMTWPSDPIEREHEPIPLDLDNADENLAYRLTCSGHIHHKPSDERELRCRFITETHPFLLIAPIKVEELFLDPLLLVFHDVIYDSEITKILELANDRIERATVMTVNGSMVSPIRTSHFAFFRTEVDKVFKTIDQRVADMTGLNANAAEQHQVANYGVGGHYGPHYDFFHKIPEGDTLGNRIATVLFYYIPLDLNNVDESIGYRLTCSEHIRQSPSDQRPLRCGYLTETHPFLLLAPIKVEELFMDPMLILFHDVIYDSEIKQAIDLATGSIERSTVMSENGSVVSHVRTSQYAFFKKEDHKFLRTIDERVADMTGLNMDVAEQHQIANYGIGGHYAQHNDFFNKHNLEDLSMSDDHLGNRIGTVLFYMSDVEEGGGTAFPYLKKLIKPKKGAAAFWFNLHASGDGDSWTKHGACPVLVGSKWVLNRWIRERGQEFKRPCELTSDALPTSVMF